MEEEYPMSKKKNLVFRIVMIQKKVGCMLEIWVWEVKGTLFCGKETLLQVQAAFTEKNLGPYRAEYKDNPNWTLQWRSKIRSPHKTKAS